MSSASNYCKFLKIVWCNNLTSAIARISLRSVCVAASDLSSTCTRESRLPGVIGITWGLLVPQMMASGLFLNMEGSDVSFTWGEHSRRAETLLDV